jgi:hypothetical protein
VAEHDNERDNERRVGRARPDLLTLIAGIATLFVSTYLLTDGAIGFSSLNPSWLLASGALVVGLVLLTASLRGRKR